MTVIKKSKREGALSYLKMLQDKGISFSSIERIFEIKQGTLNKWVKEKGKIQPEDYALLKLIVTFPWALKAIDDFNSIIKKGKS